MVAITAISAAGLMACSITLPYLTGRVIDDSLTAGDRSALAPLVVAVVVICLIRFALGVVRRWVSGKVSLAVEFDIRSRFFAHLQRQTLSYFDGMSVGQLMSRATSDLQTVRFFLGYGLIFVFMQAFTLIIVTGILLWMNVGLAVVALLMGPALLVVAWRYSRRSNPVLIDVQQRLGEVTEMAEESAVSIRVIKAFGREGERSDRFGATARHAFDRSMDAAHLRALYEPLMGFLPILGLGVILVYGGILTIDGTLSLGEFVAFYLYLTLLVAPFRSLGALVGQAQRAVAGGTRIFEVLDSVPAITPPASPVPLPQGGGHIRLEGVGFAYGPDAPPVLSDIDLDIPAGRTVALIGPTGSGKSTLTQLIPRFYDVTGGRLTVDGVDVRDLDPGELRRAIGMVSQDPFLFSTTVRANIAYGRPEASDEEVRRAARMAQAEGFIDSLPDGFDTVIGERGLTLSGGQRQRLAIARAIVTDPRVLILDEATASVDASTEREIQAALAAVMEGRTTVVIAHRLSTVSLADELVVLESGRVVAEGTHAELYETSETYREIHDGGLVRPDLIAGDA
jgi:ABC-type multidrug transport system fused ATPase/permease subunit